MCRAKKYLLIVLFTVCAFVFALHSSDSYAFDLTQDVDLIRGNMVVQFLCSDCSNVSTVAGSGGNTTLTNQNQDLVGILRSTYFDLPTESYQVGDYLTLDIYIFSNINNNTLDSYIKSLMPNTNGWDLVDVSFESLSSGSGVVHFTLRNFIAGSYSTILMTSTSNSYAALYFNEYLTGGLATHWRPKSSLNYSSQIQDVVDAIESQPSYTSQLNTINNNISQLQQSVEDANDDANDRYQDEKDTIQDNADNSVDSWEDAQQNLSFQAPTGLFSWFWSLGTTDQCINIPVLASLLHSTETTYCSWWSTEIRSIVSPIINIFLVCIVSGFIIKWLRSSGL